MLETLGFSLSVAVIGMAVVFFGLVVLVFLFKLMSAVVRAMTGRKAKKQAAIEAPAPAPAQIAPPAPAPAQEDDGELAAVITAAVAAMMGTSQSGIVVRSIRRVGVNVPSWNAAGRNDIINTRV